MLSCCKQVEDEADDPIPMPPRPVIAIWTCRCVREASMQPGAPHSREVPEPEASIALDLEC